MNFLSSFTNGKNKEIYSPWLYLLFLKNSIILLTIDLRIYVISLTLYDSKLLFFISSFVLHREESLRLSPCSLSLPSFSLFPVSLSLHVSGWFMFQPSPCFMYLRHCDLSSRGKKGWKGRARKCALARRLVTLRYNSGA